jgi:hypothetical protein
MGRLTSRSGTSTSPARRRLGAAIALSAAAAVAVVLIPTGAVSGDDSDDADGYKKAYAAKAGTKKAATDGSGTVYNADGTHTHLTAADESVPHNHNDPRTKNAVSRAATVTDASTADPTTATQARAAVSNAAAQRDQTEPKLSSVPVTSVTHASTPTDRYNMFNACYGVQSASSGRWLTGATTPTFSATSIGAGEPLYFKPSALGSYLLYTRAGTFLDANQPTARYAAEPGPTNDWVTTMPTTGLFRFEVTGKGFLTDAAGTPTITATGSRFRLQLRTGCKDFPEVSTNVTGNPISGVTRTQEVRGFVDAHTHGMAFEFLGGDIHCGRPWSPYGVTVALRDCPDHELTGGNGALVEALLSNKPTHDPVGWPTFKDWPAPDSLTHEGTYYKWMERSWRAGQRILVNLLVENNKLCEIYPIKRNSCDDMDSIRLQAKDMRALEAYVDAQNGGPGKGWYRIVTNPDQARQVINAGKLAVVMGIETSVPFGCTQKLGVPDLKCTRATIDQQLDEVRKMGVSQMELVNKFDNALSGVAGDAGSTGVLVNGANLLETGSAWRMQTCNPNDPEIHDRDQTLAAPIDSGEPPQQDAIFGAVAEASGVTLPSLPIYPAAHHCNSLGLTDLGAHTIKGLAKRNMLFDPDHMSVKARKASLDLIDSLHYGGVLSSHSWSTPDAYPRIYQEKGFITPYAGDSNGFVEKWKRHLTWANPATYWGIGFGADINGLGAQGDPRPNAATDHPVTYPFTTLGGVKVGQQVSGQRVYDINKDGVSHYGLYPDWIQDLKMQAGQDIVTDMSRGPEAYLQMWERAYGVKPNACTNPTSKLSTSVIKSRIRAGMTSWATLKSIGQPDRRLGSTFSYCATDGPLNVQFSGAGTVTSVVKG